MHLALLTTLTLASPSADAPAPLPAPRAHHPPPSRRTLELPLYALSPPPKRRPPSSLPLWASIAGTALGVGLIGVGGVLMAFHGRCTVPRDAEGLCLDADEYANVLPALPMFLFGGAATLGFGVTLGVDLHRGAPALAPAPPSPRAGRQLMTTWTLRF